MFCAGAGDGVAGGADVLDEGAGAGAAGAAGVDAAAAGAGVDKTAGFAGAALGCRTVRVGFSKDCVLYPPFASCRR